MQIKRTMPAVVAAALALAGVAETYTWTGAQDAYWTNAANWTVGGAVATVPPGQIDTGDAAAPTAGEATDAAVFSASTGATTIDLAGLHAIKTVTVSGADAPQYTLGSSESQILRFADAGVLAIAADVVNSPTVRALGIATDQLKAGNTFYLQNDSAAEFVLGKYGYLTRVTGSAGWNEVKMQFQGAGPIRFTQQVASMAGWQVKYLFNGTGRVTFDTNLAGTHGVTIQPGVTTPVEFVFNNANMMFGDVYCELVCYGNARFTGTGKVVFESDNTAALRDARILVVANRTLTFDEGITFQNVTLDSRLMGAWTPGAFRTDTGTLVMEGTMDAAGGFRLRGGTTQVRRMDQVTTGDRIEISSGAWLSYVGAGETLTKTLVLTNGNAVIRHQGTGNLIFNSPLVTGAKTGTLTLNNASAAETVWAATDDATLPIKLQGAWRLTGALPNATVTLEKEANLSFETDVERPVGVLGLNGQSLDFGTHVYRFGVNLVSGESQLKVPAGTTLASLSCVGGSLDIRADEATITVEGQSAGAAPGWLMLNGRSAGFDAQGRLIYLVYPETVAIAARGGVVPNEASAVVGVTMRGESGAVTLAGDAVTVQTLVQKTDVPAVVDLAAGQTLTAGTLARAADAAALEIGRTKDVGTLSAAGTELVVDNPNDAAPITVRAALVGSNQQTLTKNGQGVAILDNTLTWPGTIQVNQGELSVVDPVSPHAFTLAGPGTYSLDGAGARTLTGDMTGFTGTLLLKGGVTRFKDASSLGAAGATLVVTNNAALDLSGGLEGVTFSSLVFTNRNVFISGDGPDGQGVLRPEAFNTAEAGESGLTNQSFNTFLNSRFTLMGDATLGSPNATRWAINNSVIDQRGHTLTITNVGRLFIAGTTVTNAGPVVLASREKSRAGGIMLGDAVFGEADAPTLTAGDNTHITWQGASCRAQVRPLDVTGAVTFYNFHTYNNNVTDIGFNGWAGPVTLSTPESVITLSDYNDSARALRIEGPISGPGSLKTSGSGRFYIMNPTNTFTGELNFRDTNWGKWEFGWAGSIPDYSKAAFGSGNVALLSDDTNRWPMASFAAFMNEATFTKDGTTIGFDTSLADQRLVLDNCLVTNANYNEVRNFGPGKIIVEGPGVFPGPALKLGVTGTVEVTGSEHVKLDNGSTQFTIRPCSGGWRNLTHFREAADVEMPAANYYIGCWGKTYYGHVLVENSRLFVPSMMGEPVAGGTIVVGGATAHGILELEGDSTVVSNRVVVGQQGGVGALYLRGGTLVDLGPTGGTYGHVGESGGFGYLEQTGGHLRFARAHRLGFSKSALGRTTGVLALLGGTAEQVQWDGMASGASFNLGVDGAAGHLYLKGGSLTTCSGTLSFGEWNGGHKYGFGTITVEAGSTLIQRGGIPMGRSLYHTSVFNLNGGVVEADTIFKDTCTDTACQDPDGSSWLGSKAYVNFNGGTFRLRDTANVKVFNTAPDRVTVFAGGATIDTAGRDRTLDYPLEAPAGNGVLSVDTAGVLDQEWVGSPYIEIENVGESAGFGATAYADFDSTTRRVTGIHVVSPGCNYTSAQAVIYYGAHACLTNAVTLGSSASGGLTKTGAGTLTLNAANTFTGAVRVEEGTLRVNAENALPSAAPVAVAAGAILDLNGRSLAATSLGTSGGAIKNGTLTLPSALTVDLAQAKAGTYPNFAEGTFEFPKDATVTITNAEIRDSADRFYTLFKVAGAGMLTGTPTLVNDDLAPWTLVNTGRELRLAFPAGTMLIFR